MGWLLFDLWGLIFYFAVLATIVIPLTIGTRRSWAALMRDMGIPVALVGCMLGTLSSALNITDADQVYPATSVMLIQIIYGGAVACIGYFFSPESQTKINKLVRKVPVMISAALFISAILLMCNMFVDISILFDPTALVIMAFSIFLVLLGRRPISYQLVAQSLLFGSIGCVVVGLIYRFSGFIDQGLTTSMVGLMNGLILYVLIFVLSHLEDGEQEIDTSLFTWHWLEISGFLIFMYFAPETLRETLL